MWEKNTICKSCYQKPICGMVNQPFFLSGSINANDAPPEACFFHCCRAGVLAAKTSFRQAQQDGQYGLIPFSSSHKGFIDGMIKGRYVLSGPSELGNSGDVFIQTRKSGLVQINNVFDYKPRK